MSRFWSETVRRLVPYVPGEQRAGNGVVKLNTNENPYPPSPAVLAAIAAVEGDSLRRYPDAGSARLCAALAEREGVPRDHVFVGNGSDEILAFAFLAFFSDRGPLEYPTPSYSFYPVYCDLYGIEAAPFALAETDGFVLDLTRFRDPPADPARPGGIVFPNPNAPTGRAVDLAAIEALLERRSDSVVLVDEAYADFGADSALALVARYPNLLVSRSFSKGRSLAGLRLGAAFGQPELIDALRRVKDSFNSYPVDALAETAGIASLADEPAYRDGLERIVATRAHTADALAQRGWTVLPSSANFVFARPPADGPVAAELTTALGDADVLVRHWSTPSIASWLRISIGTDEDMQHLLVTLDRIADAYRSRTV